MGGARREGQNPLVMILVVILAAFGAALIKAMISRTREYMADADGARIAGSAEGLASALMRLDSFSRRIPLEQPNPAQNNLFIVEPLAGGRGGLTLVNMFATHPPVEARVEPSGVWRRRRTSARPLSEVPSSCVRRCCDSRPSCADPCDDRLRRRRQHLVRHPVVARREPGGGGAGRVVRGADLGPAAGGRADRGESVRLRRVAQRHPRCSTRPAAPPAKADPLGAPDPRRGDHRGGAHADARGARRDADGRVGGGADAVHGVRDDALPLGREVHPLGRRGPALADLRAAHVHPQRRTRLRVAGVVGDDALAGDLADHAPPRRQASPPDRGVDRPRARGLGVLVGGALLDRVAATGSGRAGSPDRDHRAHDPRGDLLGVRVLQTPQRVVAPGRGDKLVATARCG